MTHGDANYTAKSFVGNSKPEIHLVNLYGIGMKYEVVSGCISIYDNYVIYSITCILNDSLHILLTQNIQYAQDSNVADESVVRCSYYRWHKIQLVVAKRTFNASIGWTYDHCYYYYNKNEHWILFVPVCSLHTSHRIILSFSDNQSNKRAEYLRLLFESLKFIGICDVSRQPRKKMACTRQIAINGNTQCIPNDDNNFVKGCRIITVYGSRRARIEHRKWNRGKWPLPPNTGGTVIKAINVS